MSKENTLTADDLRQFTGTEHWFRHPINRKVLYTEGVQFLAERAGAYWLLDEIAIIQPYNKRIAAEAFQLWKLTVNPDSTALLVCEDGNLNVIYRKEITFTDFPLPEIKLYFTDNVILLPSEY